MVDGVEMGMALAAVEEESAHVGQGAERCLDGGHGDHHAGVGVEGAVEL